MAAGGTAEAALIQTADLRHLATGPSDHVCRLFRWSELEDLVRRHLAIIVAGSASNCASLGDQDALERIAAHPDRWRRFVECEIGACREIGARDGGTYILIAIRR